MSSFFGAGHKRNRHTIEVHFRGGKMQYKELGRTGLRVSAIGYGGAVLGIPYYLAREDTTAPATQAIYTGAI